MQRLLKEIAEIQAGHSFRERIEPVEDGTLRVIQIKDIGPNGHIMLDDLVQVNANNIKPFFFVRRGDVLLTTRGTSRRAAVVKEDLGDTIFVAQIFAVRDLADRILPEYLAWYLNQVPAQDHFDMYTSGTTIQNIRKDVLANLPVYMPSIETQRLLLKIEELRRTERDIRKSIEHHRDILINETLFRAIKA